MDVLAELESMAANATNCDEISGPSNTEIRRWQNLFGYTETVAIEQLKAHRSNLSRNALSNDHWDCIQPEKEAEGFSREAYEHWITVCGQPAYTRSEQQIASAAAAQAHSCYLVRLEGILSTLESIQNAASLPEPPELAQGSSETVDVMFCKIDGHAKHAIENWLSQQGSAFKPTFIRLSKAKKDLDSNSIHPTIGVESTLPQHRLSSPPSLDSALPHNGDLSSHPTISPLQGEYPVWFFFYGTLADPSILRQVLSLPEGEEASPSLLPASITGGIIKSWGGKYKALVDGADSDVVHGSAYEVASKDREEALLLYETEKYEVVRCGIDVWGKRVRGLTFRFVGGL